MSTWLQHHLVRFARAEGCVALLLVFALSAPMTTLQAQLRIVTGTVTDGGSHQPLAGVSVAILGTRFGGQTGADGKYRIAGVSPAAQTLVANRIGYGTQRKALPASGDQVVNFQLETTALSLDEVVVTGTAGGELKRSIGNAVSTIDASGARSTRPPRRISAR